MAYATQLVMAVRRNAPVGAGGPSCMTAAGMAVSFHRMTPWVLRLLIANVAVFFLMQAAPEMVPLQNLAFSPRAALVRPWTFLTYMFLHGGLGHLVFNMIALYFFGPRLETRIGSGHFIRMYFAAGITGAALSMIFTPAAWIIGASGGVFGVMYGFAHFWPRERVYIWAILPVEARWLVIGTTAFALFGGFSGAQRGVAHFAHLGGYVGAFAYLWYLTRKLTASRRDWQQRVNATVGTVEPAHIPAIDLERIHPVNRDEVARIVDKAREGGVESLTNQERTFLSHFTVSS